MQYKGYRIVINYPAVHFYELDEEGEQGVQIEGINYQSNDTEGWYSVIGEGNWVEQSFETIDECKEYIDEELEVEKKHQVGNPGDNMHDKYDVDIEQAIRILPYDGRDNDEKGKGAFCDLANRMVEDFKYMNDEERWEALYNVLHKVREAQTAQLRLDGIDQGDKVALIWSIDDVLAIDSELTNEQAREILANFENHHDGSQETLWNDLEYHVDEFKREKE